MKKGNNFILTGLLLIAAALFLTGYNLWDNYRAGQAADESLEQLLPLMEEPHQDEVEYPEYVLNPNMDMPVKHVDGADYIGVLSIPAIDRELPVFSEWSYPNLKIAPCRYVGSAYLDNMVICAHNYDIHFGPLKLLRYGDAVTFTDVVGNVFNYEVSEIEILNPDEVERMTANECDLTLFTCTIGGATRVTVRCDKA